VLQVTASIHGHKTLSNLLVAVRSIGVTVNAYLKELLMEAITLIYTMPSASSTMYMSRSNCRVRAEQKVYTYTINAFHLKVLLSIN